MFDSLSLVAELASVPFEELLTTLYGDDELKHAEVLAAMRRVSTAELRHRAEAVRGQEADLASGVDAAAGLTRLRTTEPSNAHKQPSGATGRGPHQDLPTLSPHLDKQPLTWYEKHQVFRSCNPMRPQALQLSSFR
jgi:hypothetical protein